LIYQQQACALSFRFKSVRTSTDSQQVNYCRDFDHSKPSRLSDLWSWI